MLERRGASVRIANLYMDVVKTLLLQLRHTRVLGEGIREVHAPCPWIFGQGLGRFDDPCWAAVNGEVMASIAAPLVGPTYRP
jgi:hypothetical protein